MVQVFNKLLQGCFPVAPYGEDVVNISPPDERLGAGISQKFVFYLCHKEVGIRRSHPCAHCCAVDL